MTQRIKFRQMLEASREPARTDEAVEGINDTGLGYVISYTLHLIGQVHMWHLLTSSAQVHETLEELYDGLREEIDGTAEKFIAQGGTLETISNPLLASAILPDIKERLDEYRKVITDSIEVCSRAELATLRDNLVHVQDILDKAIYKLNLQ